MTVDWMGVFVVLLGICYFRKLEEDATRETVGKTRETIVFGKPQPRLKDGNEQADFSKNNLPPYTVRAYESNVNEGNAGERPLAQFGRENATLPPLWRLCGKLAGIPDINFAPGGDL